MSGSPDLWIWKKRLAKVEETLWENRLADVEGAVITEEVTVREGVNRAESGAGSHVLISVYAGSKADAAAWRRKFGGEVERLEVRDWVAESARPEPPVVVRKALVVTQEVDPEALEVLGARYPGRRVLSVPAQMAFGTGQHATTSTCLRMLADIGKVRKAGWTMVDIGTGSGLLAFGARIFGAAEGGVDAFDFDEKCVEVSEENAARNGIGGIRFWREDVLAWRPRRRYDVVAANLYSGLLVAALPTMRKAAEAGADLILSGILQEQLDEVLPAAELAGFAIFNVVRRGKWAGVRAKAEQSLH